MNRSFLTPLAILLFSAAALGQQFNPVAPIRWDWSPIQTPVAIPADDGKLGEVVYFAKVYQPPATSIARMLFQHWDLPPGVVVRLTSLKDGDSAELDSTVLDAWSGYTPMFNGDQLLVEIVGRSAHGPGLIVIASIGSMHDPNAGQARLQLRNLCGADDRIRANNTGPVARFWLDGFGSGRCTASLIGTGEHMVSAGHCGMPTSGGLVEFDPPDSDSAGNAVAAVASLQFPYAPNSALLDNDFTYRTCGTEQCIDSFGDDALVFRVGVNSLGQTAGMARASYMRITLLSGVPGNSTATMWGCGVGNFAADNTKSRTMKRISFALGGTTDADGGLYWEYEVDQTKGDSGGPIVSAQYNAAIGVVSSGSTADCTGCMAYSFNDIQFANLVETAVQASTTKFVDGASIAVSPILIDGSIWDPARTFRGAGYDAVPLNGRVMVAPGVYSTGDGVLSRACTIRAPLGAVTLFR